MNKGQGKIVKKPKSAATFARYCVNCRNHGEKISISGHKSACKFRECHCELCALTERARIISLQERKLHRELDKASKPQIAVEIKNEAPDTYQATQVVEENVVDRNDQETFHQAEDPLEDFGETLGYDFFCGDHQEIFFIDSDPAMEFVDWINL